MKVFVKLICLSVFMLSVGHASAAGVGGSAPKPDENDSTINSLKSNIVIFKMITSSPNPAASGSLKKAGRVARTSYSHTSIEGILYKKQGI